ncbi:sugar ABC transporter substrate-binding protein [Bacillus coahuilensis]|uniref:sugar ABC transporter substrate-binding protein n=1 Tax=Bacillus coahuilensis TaxID=408580 RepID=UPI0009E9CB9A|nr:substrate-binding domain-containing protein [Bacillus coahuilensis]
MRVGIRVKRPFRNLLILFIALLAGGCVNQPAEQAATSEVDQKVEEMVLKPGPMKIGFSMDTLLEERWERDRTYFKEAVEALGAEVDIQTSNGDDALQISQAESLIRSGIDVLVIVPHNAESTAIIVKKAHSAGVKVLAYDRLVKNAEIDLYVSYDNEQVGRLQAEAIASVAPKGKYVYIGGAETDHNAHLTKKGVYRILKSYIDAGDVSVVYDQWTKDWVPTNAYHNMKEALEANPEGIDAVIAANDATAGAASLALLEYGLLGKVPVAGQDAELAAIQRIVRGEQTMTVYKPIQSLAREAAKLAVQLAAGEEIEVTEYVNNGKMNVPSVLLSPIAVYEHNIQETIIADGFHSEEDVFKGLSE